MQVFKFLKIILITSFLLPTIALSSQVSIKYVVEDSTITNIDIKNEINYLLLINDKLSDLDSDLLVEYAIKSILREKIKEIELKKNFIFGENTEIVNEQLINFRNSLNIPDDQNFDELLNQLNLTKRMIYKKMEIELLWNKLIYEKFINQVYVDQVKIENDLKLKIKNSNLKTLEYLIHEILFSSDTKNELELSYKKIMQSISEIGFENTASILSISDTALYGGKIGWLSENQLSTTIVEKIKNLEIQKPSEPISTPNGILILMVKEKREIQKEFSFEQELQKMINAEAENQLNQFSQIFFKKIELNTKVYEK